MDLLSAINPNTSLVSILTSKAVTPSYGLLSAELSLSNPGIFGNSSTYVGISARGQMLSATVLFQIRLQSLRSGTVTDNGDNSEAAFASLKTRTETLVSSFNTLQASVADTNGTNGLFASTVSGSANLVQSLDTQAQAVYANGSSSLTQLSQLGIEFKPAQTPGAGSTLTLDPDILLTAFEADSAGAASLLAKVANSFNTAASGFISQASSRYASLDTLMQSSLGFGLLPGYPQVQSDNSLFNLLTTQPQTGGTNWGRAYAAMSEYNMVAQLFG